MTRLLALALTLSACTHPIDEPPGERLEAAQLLKSEGCLLCHSLDGAKGSAPTFLGLWGRRVTVVRDGKRHTLTADADYIRRAITDPDAEVVDGYVDGAMTRRDRTPERMTALLDALRLLSTRPAR